MNERRKPLTAYPGETEINKAARKYMAEYMGMADAYEDQEQNWILSHLATFGTRVLRENNRWGQRRAPAKQAQA